MNWANVLTLFHLAVLPLIIYSLFWGTAFSSFLALILLALIILSDIFDGILARRQKKETKIGSFLDPLTDKIVIYALSILFWLEFLMSGWLLIIFMLRDIMVNIFRWFSSRQEIILPEEKYRKLLKVAQFSLLLLLMLEKMALVGHHSWLSLISEVVKTFTLITGMLTLFSIFYIGYFYLIKIREDKKRGKELKEEKMIILANPRSRGYHDGYRRRLLWIFSRRRKAPIICLPLIKNMFEKAEENIGDAKQIIIAGGDGSFESALNYKPFQKKSLGFFPLGAGNAFYSHFYKGHRFEYLRSRFQFQEMNLDVLELEWDGQKKQTLFSSVGLDAEVVRLSQERTQSGFFDYIKGSWQTLWKIKAAYDLQVTVDGKKQKWNNSINLTLGKVPYYGYALRSLLQVKPHNGFVYGLGVVNAHSFWFNKTLRVWSLILTSLGLERSPLIKIKGKEILVESKVPFPVQAGGEFLGYSQYLRARVVRKQKVLVI